MDKIEQVIRILKNDECRECAESLHLWNMSHTCLVCKVQKINQLYAPLDEGKLGGKILQKIRDDIAAFDCQGDCPDEVAVYEKDHPGETIRTDDYCDKCFTSQLLSLIRQSLPELAKKAVRQEVVDKLKEYYRDEGGLELPLSWTGIVIDDPEWQAQLKEWGIER